MTGYASKVFELEDYTAQIDIRSLNSKFLDMHFRLPFALEYMEDRLRKLLKIHVKRGKVDIFMKLMAHEQLEINTISNLVDKYYRIIKKIQDDMNAHFQVSLSEILSLKDLINPYEEFVYREVPQEKIEEIFLNTINAFQESRYIEGENTKKEILSHLEVVNNSLMRISATYPSIVEKYKEQLKEKVQELIEGKIDETRIMIEVGIFANKVDISEEISRIKGHVGRMMSTLHSEEACGKELDFILQELNREVNTIGSKIPDYSVSKEVVNLKSCLEKIKEQVRNVE